MQERKLDALDLVLNVLREHEESLDSLIERLETLIEASLQYSIASKTSARK